MSSRTKIFDSVIGIFSFTFLILATISFTIGEIIFATKASGAIIYVSIFFIFLVEACSIFIFLLLRRFEEKFFLYILFVLPITVFSIIRFIEAIDDPVGYIFELITMIASLVFIIAFLVTTLFFSEKRTIEAQNKKRGKIVDDVLSSQERYREALERKKEVWEKVIEEN
jgi:hypothetical protein